MERHSELELKFSAEEVAVGRFRVWCMGLDPVGYKTRAYPDNYYCNGDAVVRHRGWPLPGGELTVKRRKSACSIVNRQEINLQFAAEVSQGDVVAFLEATGWTLDFILLKHFSHVFWFKHGEATICVSLYEVERADTKETRRFLEVEIERDSEVTEATARELLDLWGGAAAHEFDLDEPMTDSLWEIYSGRRYSSIDACTRPPPGWLCTRGPHVDGPCAAVAGTQERST